MRSELRSRLTMSCWRFSRAHTKPRRISAGGTGLRSSAHQRSKTTKEKVMAQQCTHLNQIRNVTPSAQGCEDCLKTGDTWVHLRLCLRCTQVSPVLRRSEEHTSELQSQSNLVCRLLLEKKKKKKIQKVTSR